MKQVALKILVGLVATAISGLSNAATCATDTTQADFQAGTISNVDLTSSFGNVVLATSSGGSGSSIDQQNLTNSGYGDIYNNSQWIAQTFKAGASGSLTRVDLDLGCAFCSGTPPAMTVSIRATSGGLPTGGDLASGTIPTINAAGVAAFYSVTFASPPSVTSGTTYAIILRASTAYSTGKTIIIDSALNGSQGNDSYPNGALYLSTNSGSSWSARVLSDGHGVDGVFKTYVGGGSSAGYVPAGDLISSVKDSAPPSGSTPTWTNLNFLSTLPTNTALKFQAAASNNASGPFSFVGPDGTSASFFTTTGADLSRFNGNRYLKYRAFLSTTSSASTPVLSEASVCYSSTSTATSSDVSITVDDGATTEVPGTNVTYTIVASNAGPDPVSRATVSDAFTAPLSGCSWTCSATAGGFCTASGTGSIADNAVSLPVGGKATYSATCSIASSATGSLATTATITDPSGVTDANSANNTDTDTDTLTPQVDLALTNSDGQTSQTAGLQATYSIQTVNNGPSDAPNSTVVDNFPSSLSCTWTCTQSGGASCPASGSGNINATVNLPKGAHANFTATCSIASSASGTLSNGASISPANGIIDTNTGNNSVTDSDTLVVKPDVTLTMTDNQDMVQIGDLVDYVLVVSNQGPSDAAVNLTDNLPAQLSTKATWVCTGTGGAVCSKGQGNSMNTNATIPAGGVATYVYSSSVISDDSGNSYTNVAVAHVNNGTDPNSANNSASDTDIIVVFLSGFEAPPAPAMMLGASSSGSGSMTVQFGVDAGQLNHLGPAPVTVATGNASNGAKLFDLQLIRLGTQVMMRSVVPVDATVHSDVSPWENVDLKQGGLRLQWQPATTRGDDGYLRAGTAARDALVAANNAREGLASLKVRVENNIPWLVLQGQ